ncbi:MAG: hypothetical protein EAZ95_11045 [Bacteroidetes bacterium]|nr:MAG: hypothetical protein EAZ95_11045 [Bacteroidota bacterium]
MKNFFLLMLSIALFFPLACTKLEDVTADSQTKPVVQRNDKLGKISVDVTLHGIHGCTVKIKGEVRVNSSGQIDLHTFTGVITVSGGPLCPHGSVVIGRPQSGGDADIVFDTDNEDICQSQDIIWGRGNTFEESMSEILTTINDSNIRTGFLKSLKATAECQ